MAEENYFMEKQMEILIDMKVAKLKTELKDTVAQLTMMKEEVNMLRNKVDRLNNTPRPITQEIPVQAQQFAQPVQQMEMAQQQIQPQIIPPIQQAPRRTSETSQRTGAFAPGDANVSIDKMFYFGNKKQ